LVASIIPLGIFLYLFFKFMTQGRIETTGTNFKILLLIAGVFSILGFWGTRRFLIKIVTLSNRLKVKSLDKIDRSDILELAKGEGEVAQLAKVFGEITTNLEESVRELNETKKTLYEVLSKIGKTIGSIENFDVLIQFILETIVEALGAKRGAIYSQDPEKEILRRKAVVGIDAGLTPLEIKFGEEAVGWIAKERKSLLVPSLEGQEGSSLFSPPLAATPLIAHDKVWGVIALSGNKAKKNFSEEELNILSNLAYQIAVSFENFALNAEVEKSYFETISALALAVEAKDHYSRGHSERVAEYALKLAEHLGLSKKDLDTLRDAARLHDIGKIGIADEILKKPGKLNTTEMTIMREHPKIGEGIVRPLKSFHHLINPIRHHHEFLDGTGYPDGLKGEEIPQVTRILTVSDIFEALTSGRPYRQALSIEETKKEMSQMTHAGKLDRQVVGALFKLIEESKIKR
jgi:putative nucleotidyltransferase with HDIG domain